MTAKNVPQTRVLPMYSVTVLVLHAGVTVVLEMVMRAVDVAVVVLVIVLTLVTVLCDVVGAVTPDVVVLAVVRATVRLGWVVTCDAVVVDDSEVPPEVLPLETVVVTTGLAVDVAIELRTVVVTCCMTPCVLMKYAADSTTSIATIILMIGTSSSMKSSGAYLCNATYI